MSISDHATEWICSYCGRKAYMRVCLDGETFYCSECYKNHHPDGIKYEPESTKQDD